MTQTLAPSTAVALIKDDPRGLRATGAFDRFDRPFAGDAKPGDLVEVTTGRHAEPVRRFGRPSSVHAVIAALAEHAGERPFTAEHEHLAAQAAATSDRFDRRDLRALPTFTIDGDSTRDFDDALSARREGDAIRVWVHVADVSAYVRPGAPLDLEARRRATSFYLPTLTVPMLPKALSTGVCSLVPGEDRGAVTCEVLLRDGQVVDRAFYRSLIRSDARLTYTHVEDIFLGRAEPGPTYAAALAAARQAAIDRTAEAAERGNEPVFEITDGEVTGIQQRPEQESQRLIERLMVLANQEVARFLRRRAAPTLYRTHSAGDDDRMQRLVARLVSLGVTVNDPSVDGVAAAVDEHEKAFGPNETLRGLLRGVRPPAAYQREPAAHEGLGIGSYCHFTSPIRRYADLIVHRALLAELDAEPLNTAPRHVHLDTLAEHLNERTRAAKKLERRAIDICRVSLLRHRLRTGALERSLTGVISGMSAHGCYVTVDCAEGLLSGRDLGGDPNEPLTIWQTPARELRIGEQVRVRIRTVDPVRGQLRLALA